MAEAGAESRPRVWLLSPYRADSHAAWGDWLAECLTEVSWRCIELPGRNFAWRIRGNPVSWLDSLPAEQPDLILATSMTDLATLKGLHPRLAPVPSVYYFHENQFAYPRSKRQLDTLEPKMVQLYGGLCADRLLFNSAFNRDSYLDGVATLLTQMPDAVPENIRGRLAEKCGVLPVPIEPIAPAEKQSSLILWNHRWEYDKVPELFAEAMLSLAGEGVDFQLALLGARPRHHIPEALGLLRERLGARIVADGKLPRDEYRRLVARSAIVVSTARHEFQGLSVLEAVSAGARPLVPDALCYPEQFPEAYRYVAGDLGALTTRLRHWLTEALPPPVDVSAWYADSLAFRWHDMLQQHCRDDPGKEASVKKEASLKQERPVWSSPQSGSSSR